MKKFQVDSYKLGSKIHLLGYTSTSLKAYEAKKFAVSDKDDGKVAVVFVIEFRGQKGLFEMTRDYTAYPDEGEVLLQDGLQYLITDKTESKCEATGIPIHLIKLQYPV